MPEQHSMTRDELKQSFEDIIQLAHIIHKEMVKIGLHASAVQMTMPRSFVYAAHQLRMAVCNARDEAALLRGDPIPSPKLLDPGNEVTQEIRYEQ